MHRIGNARFHCCCNFQAFVNSAKVIVHVVIEIACVWFSTFLLKPLVKPVKGTEIYCCICEQEIFEGDVFCNYDMMRESINGGISTPKYSYGFCPVCKSCSDHDFSSQFIADLLNMSSHEVIVQCDYDKQYSDQTTGFKCQLCCCHIPEGTTYFCINESFESHAGCIATPVKVSIVLLTCLSCCDKHDLSKNVCDATTTTVAKIRRNQLHILTE